KEKMNCKGCKIHAGEVFWGTYKIASCAISKNLSHCGECEEFPCEKLISAHNTKGHSDNGERMTNLKKWANGEDSELKVTPKV
ncbi:MAG: DUF3795 domain-containing protein, partial [Bacillota bacterium]|nr:DUF3795 domain-containing protein [Bacillota bacterium]